MSPPLVGVLLAAGRSRRMGRTKQLMPWPPGGTTPLVAATFDALAAMCDRTVVVLGHEADAVAGALGARDFVRVDSDPDAEMLVSVRAGLRAALAIHAAPDIALHPADQPLISADTCARLQAVRACRGIRAAFPTHAGRGGHPVVIPAALLPSVLRWDHPGGLRELWIEHARLTRRIEVDDPGVVRDLDLPGDYV